MKKIIVYHTNWSTYGRNYQVKHLPIDYITDVCYAFYGLYLPVCKDPYSDFDKAYTGDDGLQIKDSWNDPDQLRGNFGQFQKLKKLGKKFTFSLSIGGWTWSKNFSLAVRTAENRKAFVAQLLQIHKRTKGIIDSVSFDWEYVSNDGKNYGCQGNICHSDDEQNFYKLLRLLKQTLALHQINWFISTCTSAAPQKVKFDPARMNELIDQFHLMTYDFSDGAWGDKICTHHTNLFPTKYTKYSVQTAVELYIEKGVPRQKICIGAALYSRGFSNSEGLYKSGSGPSSNMSWENGVVDYKALPLAGAKQYFDKEACASYSYDPVSKIFNSYENHRSIVKKCQYVKEMGLRGIIFWESSGDHKIQSERSLIRNAFLSFSGKQIKFEQQGEEKPEEIREPIRQRQKKEQRLMPKQQHRPKEHHQHHQAQESIKKDKKQQNYLQKQKQHRIKEVQQFPQKPIPQQRQPVQFCQGLNLVIGQVVSRGPKLYKVIQAHRSQSDWTPENVPALFSPLK